jgi:hypothetical protein
LREGGGDEANEQRIGPEHGKRTTDTGPVSPTLFLAIWHDCHSDCLMALMAAIVRMKLASAEQFVSRQRQELLELVGGDQLVEQAGGGFEVGEVAERSKFLGQHILEQV